MRSMALRLPTLVDWKVLCFCQTACKWTLQSCKVEEIISGNNYHCSLIFSEYAHICLLHGYTETTLTSI